MCKGKQINERKKLINNSPLGPAKTVPLKIHLPLLEELSRGQNVQRVCEARDQAKGNILRKQQTPPSVELLRWGQMHGPSYLSLALHIPATYFPILSLPSKRQEVYSLEGFPGGASGKEPACQCRRCKILGFDPWVGKTPWEGHGYPLQYSCLENLMNRGVWWATVHGLQRVGHWSDLACIHVTPWRTESERSCIQKQQVQLRASRDAPPK